ncbi:uncharacterized protein LOC127808871 [Diospyros lotus]|uniref:uncharacterized protein LOC127808871 n=1 Tax=Diospyros lotus TaxID=55363 RepID=UPI002252D082|nr:uncharacterized protein LOC127808871 [Diospyros lotus]
MSKKKASGGSTTTMTLKDFHGGSIPSDLRLPSAPGLIVRPSDRQGSWGNPIGRSDHRLLRPGSAGAARSTFDDKAPFLTPGARIGRNFDEDERKPLDGGSGPRRTVSEESIRVMPTRGESKPDYSCSGRLPSRQASVSQLSSGGPGSYAGRVAEASPIGGNSQNFGGNTASQPSGAHPNAWAMRKEVVSPTEPLPAALSSLNAASKLAHASALEKVSSGRWQSKQSVHHPTDVEAIRHNATESEFHSKGESFYGNSSLHMRDSAGSLEYHDAMLVRHAEKSLTIDDGMRSGGRELPTYERARSPMYSKTIESKPTSHTDRFQPPHNGSKFGGLELPSPVPSDQSECPKLKLLPRSKPLEGSESNLDYKQPRNSDHRENVAEPYGNANTTKSGLSGADNGNQTVERPKLNLKPRSQPLEQLEGNTERERNSVFGGARPRELVLKDRGVDDVIVNDHDGVQPPDRIKRDVPRTETVPTHAMPTRYNEKADNTPVDNRIRKNNDRRDNRVDAEKTDNQRRNWRSENWRTNREIEKHQQPQQQPQERPPSPETWRRPAEQPKPVSSDSPGLRYGKTASAVELACAFSKSVSDPKAAERFHPHRGTPGRGAQMPFSRLMDTNSRPQINGY